MPSETSVEHSCTSGVTPLRRGSRVWLLAVLMAGCAHASPTSQPVRAPSVEDFVRVRCSVDGSNTITAWRGAIYAYPPGAKPVHVFDVVGMNAARCARDMRGWYITGREVMLYLDPDTGKQLHRWRNPWTNGEVSVVHVANDPVQFRLSGAPRSKTHGGVIYFHIDVPLFYPSPLARSPVAADHPTMYQAGEFFSLSAETKDVFDTRRATVRAMNLTWHRVGPWLPWMGMGRRPGLLVYSARGHRVSSRDALPAELKAALDRLPGYDRAPTCYLARPNATSWTYFAAHHAAHARGVRFPVKARAKMGPCKQP